MRGSDGMQEGLFTMAKLEDFVPSDHPLRPIQVLVNEALGRLNGLFNEIYADTGRQSIAPGASRPSSSFPYASRWVSKSKTMWQLATFASRTARCSAWCRKWALAPLPSETSFST